MRQSLSGILCSTLDCSGRVRSKRGLSWGDIRACLPFVGYGLIVSSLVWVHIRSSSILVIMNGIRRPLVVATTVGAAWHSATVTEPVIGCVSSEAEPPSSLAPLLIEMIGLLFPHVLVVIVAVDLIANSLSDHLSSLVVKHALMASLLQSCARVIVHLLPLNDSIALAYSTCHFILICLFNWPTVGTLLCGANESLLDEVPIAHASH